MLSETTAHQPDFTAEDTVVNGASLNTQTQISSKDEENVQFISLTPSPSPEKKWKEGRAH